MNSRTPANRPNKVSNNNKDKNSLINRLAVDLNAIHTPVDLSLSVLRATVGIITFLRTGSLAVTSMILGNSIEVTESNYVPRWLVRRFGNRTLRILAQKLIVVATHGHPWAQAASDFLHSDDLHRFIVRILNEATGNDPFAVVARKSWEVIAAKQTLRNLLRVNFIFIHILRSWQPFTRMRKSSHPSCR